MTGELRRIHTLDPGYSIGSKQEARISFMCTYSMSRSTRSSIRTFILSPIFLVEHVREQNPSGKVYIMECAGDGLTSENFKRMGYNHENIPGVDEFI